MLNCGEILNNYRVEDMLGMPGAFGQTFKVADTTTGQLAALKVLKMPNDLNAKNRFYQENKITKGLNSHPRIIEILSGVVDIDPQKIHYVMELANGNLEDFVPQMRTFLEKMGAFKHVCEGLLHAHQNNIVHRDLHWRNILTKNQAGGTDFKLTDFGMAKDFNLNSLTAEGKINWGGFVKPPENHFRVWDIPSLDMSKIGDIYALGVILYFLFGIIPQDHVSETTSSMDYFMFIHKTLAKGEKDRMLDYNLWLSNLDQNKFFPEFLLVDKDENTILNTLLSKLFNIDYRRRFQSVDEVIEDLNKITI